MGSSFLLVAVTKYPDIKQFSGQNSQFRVTIHHCIDVTVAAI